MEPVALATTIGCQRTLRASDAPGAVCENLRGPTAAEELDNFAMALPAHAGSGVRRSSRKHARPPFHPREAFTSGRTGNGTLVTNQRGGVAYAIGAAPTFGVGH